MRHGADDGVRPSAFLPAAEKAAKQARKERLLHKQAIVAEKDGRRSLYSPRLTRDAWVAVQSESLLDRAFGGRIAPLVAHFAEHRKLTRKDLADLKKLIAEIDDAT